MGGALRTRPFDLGWAGVTWGQLQSPQCHAGSEEMEAKRSWRPDKRGDREGGGTGAKQHHLACLAFPDRAKDQTPTTNLRHDLLRSSLG